MKIVISFENLKYELNFLVFNNNRNYRIKELKEFLMENKRIDKKELMKIVERFYCYIDYGF